MTDMNTIPTAADPVTRGHNNPPSLLDAEGLAARFGTAEEPGQYSELMQAVAALLANVRETAPVKVETDAENGIIAAHMESLRTTLKTINNHKDHEKAQYLAAERFIQQFFAGAGDRVQKARDILQARGNDYTQRKVAQEKAERARVAAAEAAAARLAREEEARKAAEAAEISAKAERARKAENIAALEQKADAAHADAAVAQVDTLIANSRAENAALAAQASSASIARTRHASGHLSTAKQAPHVEIVDKMQLDMAALLPFIKEDVLLSALKAWARITDHKQQMTGAVIEMRDVADYR